MKKNYAATLAGALAMAGMVFAGPIKVHTIGDSTMQTYDESSTNTRGWGQYFQQFFTDGVTVNNRGKAGASSKSFYKESAFWTSVKTQMSPGDYVLIQFSHNDEKTGGTDGDSVKAYYNRIGETTKAETVDYRGTTPYDTYKQYLRKYVMETREAGCNPVLVAPISRMYFSGNDIRRSGRHDLGDSFSQLTATGVVEGQRLPADDNTMDYVYQMQQVAAEMNVPFIDLTTATANLYLEYGDEKCHTLLGDGKGSTHLSAVGATLIAREAASLLKKSGILSDFIDIPSELSVSPSEADMGEAYRGQVLLKEFSVNAFSLTPSEGTITVTGSEGIQLSTDKAVWKSTATIDYTDGAVVTNFYAQVALGTTDTFSGTIKVQQGEKTITIPVKAKAVSMEGGTEVKAYWRLESNDEYTLQGPAQVVGQSMEGMYVQRYASPGKAAVWPEGTGYDATRKTQRNLVVGDTWPGGEIDEVSTRYIQFGITPSAGTTLKIDSIGMYVCGSGGNGMQCHISYSTEPDFAHPHTYFSPVKMPANNMMAASVQPVVSLEEGDTLRVRVYPWYGGTATGKTICLSDVTIHGKAFDATTAGVAAVTRVAAKDDAWYNLQGQKVAQATAAIDTLPKGIYICKGQKYMVR